MNVTATTLPAWESVQARQLSDLTLQDWAAIATIATAALVLIGWLQSQR